MLRGGRRRGRRGRVLRPRDDRRDQRAARGTRRPHRADRHPWLRRPARDRPPGSPSLYRLCAPKPTPLVATEMRFEADERTGPEGVVEPLGRGEPERLARRWCASRRAESVGDLPALLLPDPAHERRSPSACASAYPTSTSPPRTRCCRASASTSAARRPRSTPTSRRCSAATWAGSATRPTRPACPTPLVMQSSGGVAAGGRGGARGRLERPLGPGGRGRRGRPARPRQRRRQRARLRHGRHLVRRLRGRGRRGRGATDSRTIDGPPDPAADGRRPHGRRRRRLGRLARPGRRPAGRAALGRRRCPGPPATGAAAREPTVTDANLLLGKLAADSTLAGGVALDAAAAERAVGALADELGLDPLETADGIVRVADQEMVRALRVDDGRARRRPAPLRPAAVRRRRADARRGDRRGARDRAHALPARRRRALRLRPLRLRPAPRHRPHRDARRRRPQRASGSPPRSAS